MLKRQACVKFQSTIFDEGEVIQILKVVRWHFCQVYTLCFESDMELNLRSSVGNSEGTKLWHSS